MVNDRSDELLGLSERQKSTLALKTEGTKAEDYD